MWNVVEWSKYREETISIVISFADDFLPSEVITGTPSIIVTVFTGVDPSPSLILYQGTAIANGTVIDQKFRLGVVGVIYHIEFSILTTLGDTYQKECYLAILPEDGIATPTFTNVWFTSNLYPYNDGPEYVQSYFGPSSGKLWYQPRWQESIKNSFLLLSGNLFSAVKSYVVPHEDIKTAFTPASGVLTLVVLYYTNYAHEDIKSSFALLSGNIFQSSVSYAIVHEDIKTSFALVSGTLV